MELEINYDEQFDKFFSELVPDSGNCNTIEGELLRGINRIMYRYYNDGDVFHIGYGRVTCGSAATFILDQSNNISDIHAIYINMIEAETSTGEDYIQIIEESQYLLIDHLISLNGNYTPNSDNLNILTWPSKWIDESE